jgi:hypothetical protein
MLLEMQTEKKHMTLKPVGAMKNKHKVWSVNICMAT